MVFPALPDSLEADRKKSVNWQRPLPASPARLVPQARKVPPDPMVTPARKDRRVLPAKMAPPVPQERKEPQVAPAMLAIQETKEPQEIQPAVQRPLQETLARLAKMVLQVPLVKTVAPATTAPPANPDPRDRPDPVATAAKMVNPETRARPDPTDQRDNPVSVPNIAPPTAVSSSRMVSADKQPPVLPVRPDHGHSGNPSMHIPSGHVPRHRLLAFIFSITLSSKISY